MKKTKENDRNQLASAIKEIKNLTKQTRLYEKLTYQEWERLAKEYGSDVWDLYMVMHALR